MEHPLDGARERLKRADENIRNLHAEVSQFLAPLPRVRFDLHGNDIVFSDKDRNAFDKLRQRILAGTAMPRFGVLAGEIVHHLRSAFDHVVWQLSTAEARRKFANEIEFPVCESPPECVLSRLDCKVKHSSYCRKVKGVTSSTALVRIDSLQPYKRVDRHNSPLLIIHILDKFDKHRELVDVIPQAVGYGRGMVLQRVQTIKDSASGGRRIVNPVAGPPEMKVYVEMFAQVAFTQLREWEAEPLVPFLQNLLRFASDTVEIVRYRVREKLTAEVLTFSVTDLINQ